MCPLSKLPGLAGETHTEVTVDLMQLQTDPHAAHPTPGRLACTLLDIGSTVTHILVTKDVRFCSVLSRHKPGGEKRLNCPRTIGECPPPDPTETWTKCHPSSLGRRNPATRVGPVLPSSVSSGTTEGTENIPDRVGPASPGKPDDPGMTSIETLNQLTLSGNGKTRALNESSTMPSYCFLWLGTRQVPTGTGEQITSLAKSTLAMGSSTARTPGPKRSSCSGGLGDRSR
ncbi:hypothetical protein E2C01_031685 [Portunus trituberculatus]|uniref:Uncharacterized protein n=1 Tax=Portunus trituberculatus TaxID=210409 RepID=A0A5B7EU51_PORTR|nr:hypothetical protein [Portunus trituberculatus]